MTSNKSNNWLLFALDTGRGVQTVRCPEGEALSMAAMMNLGCISASDDTSNAQSYVDIGLNAVVSLPSKPSAHHVFDWIAKQWRDPHTLQDFKNAKWLEIKTQRDAETVAPILDTPFGPMNANQASIQKIDRTVSGMRRAIELKIPISSAEPWTMADNTRKDLSLDQLCEVIVLLYVRQSAAHKKAYALRLALDKAKSEQDVDTVKWGKNG